MNSFNARTQTHIDGYWIAIATTPTPAEGVEPMTGISPTGEVEAVENLGYRVFGIGAQIRAKRAYPGSSVWTVSLIDGGDQAKPAPLTPAERKRRSRENKVGVSFDLSKDMAERLESLAAEFGGKKAAIEYLLTNHDQRVLPL